VKRQASRVTRKASAGVLRVHEPLQLAAVEEDPAAVAALVDVNAVPLVVRIRPWHFGHMRSMPAERVPISVGSADPAALDRADGQHDSSVAVLEHPRCSAGAPRPQAAK